jgi:adenosine kinase
LSGGDLLEGLAGAAILIVNDYEFGILTQKTKVSREDLEERIPVVVVTHGANGSTISVAGAGRRVRHEVPPARLEREAIDPTGVGDAYRAGLVRGLRIGAPWPAAGRMGSVSAVFGLEALGPQPPAYSIEDFRARYERNFGEEPILEKLRLGGPNSQLSTLNSELG